MIIRHCLYCENLISPFGYLCSDCSSKLQNAYLNTYLEECPVCGYPLVSTDYQCMNCKVHKGLKINPLLSYRDTFAKSFLELYKFDRHKEFAGFFASILEKHIGKEECVVPIPSSNAGLEKRGYDQMLLLSKHLHRRIWLLLKNNYESKVQSKELTEKERVEFSKNKFAINDDVKIFSGGKPVFSSKTSFSSMALNSFERNTPIVILDDVFTTGSTLFAAYNTLVSAGFINVRAVTLYAEI